MKSDWREAAIYEVIEIVLLKTLLRIINYVTWAVVVDGRTELYVNVKCDMVLYFFTARLTLVKPNERLEKYCKASSKPKLESEGKK